MSNSSGGRVLRESTPSFFAWCDEKSRVDALTAALSVLTRPWGVCGMTSPVWVDTMPVEAAMATLRPAFVADTFASIDFSVTLKSERTIGFGGNCCGDGAIRRGASGPLEISPFDKEALLLLSLQVPVQVSARSVEAEAAAATLLVQDDVEDLLIRLCAPDSSQRVTIGGCTRLWHWGAPIEMGLMYHVDSSSIARDLALSWVHLHDKDKMERIVGMSSDALRARVDAAARGSKIAMGGGCELSREVVMKAMDAEPNALLEALEASAMPDDEWRAVEPLAHETIAAAEAGAPTYKVDVTTRKHVQFIERHAPYHVRRLPGGGVLLATHPYRTLWQLYSDALFLLGITPS